MSPSADLLRLLLLLRLLRLLRLLQLLRLVQWWRDCGAGGGTLLRSGRGRAAVALLQLLLLLPLGRGGRTWGGVWKVPVR